MIEAIYLVTAFLTLAIALILAMRIMKIERQLASLSTQPIRSALEAPSEAGRPLAGLRIALAVKQDYPHPIFETLVKELLLSEDVAEVQIMTLDEAEALRSTWTPNSAGPELLICGEMVGNGYAEVYYRADFTCWAPDQAICTVLERPPNGDRPSNYAKELVTRLKGDLQKFVERDERRRAIRELHVD